MGCLLRHKWTDWAILERGSIIAHRTERVGWYVVQERHCMKCGRTSMTEKSNYAGRSTLFCQRVPEIQSPKLRKDGISA